jgi:hypothetical protein
LIGTVGKTPSINRNNISRNRTWFTIILRRARTSFAISKTRRANIRWRVSIETVGTRVNTFTALMKFKIPCTLSALIVANSITLIAVIMTLFTFNSVYEKSNRTTSTHTIDPSTILVFIISIRTIYTILSQRTRASFASAFTSLTDSDIWIIWKSIWTST